MTGGCLCGGVRFELEPPLRDVLVCHCSLCRRSGTLAGAYTSVPLEALRLTADETLRWYVDVNERQARLLRDVRRDAVLDTCRRRDDLRVGGRARRPDGARRRRGTSTWQTPRTGSPSSIEPCASTCSTASTSISSVGATGHATATPRCRTSRRRSTPGRASSGCRSGAARRTTRGSTSSSCTRRSDNADAIVVNPGAWTHYSWAISDALEPYEGVVVEVHISNVDEREGWRKHSVLEGLTTERVIGQGIDGYRRALELLAERRDG